VRALYIQCIREPVQNRSEDGCDMRKFRSLNDSIGGPTWTTCKTALNVLETIYLRLKRMKYRELQ